LDTLAPTAPGVALTNDTGNVGDGITSDGSLTVTPAEGGGAIEYSIDGGTTWTSSFTAVEGSNTVDVRQVDAAGNNGAPASLTFTLDQTSPAAPIVALANDTGSDGGDGITSDGSLTVIAAEGGGTIEYSTDGGTTWTSSFTASEGANTVQVRQVDDAGNNGTPASLTFTLDTLAPAAPVVASFSTDSGVLGDGITNDNTPTVSGTAEANSRVEVFRTGFSIGTTTADGSGNWSFTDPANLVDNSYVYYAQATDAAGNVSAPSNGLGLGVDTQAPTDIRLNASSALIAALAGQSSNSNTAANTSTGAGTLMGTLSAVGGSTFSIASDPTSQFVLSGNQLSLATGQQIFESEAAFNLTIQVTDSAGNAYFETFRFLPGTNTGNTMNGNNSAGTGASLATAVTGDDVIMGFRGGDTLNISGSTILGSSGDDLVFGGNSNDMLRGGAGNDQLHGGFGNDTFYGDTGDDILSGGADADQFRFVAPSTNGLDTIQDFTVNQDFLVLFSNGDGWNTAGSSGGTALNSSDYNTRSSITGIQSGDDDEVVEISAAQTGVQIATGSGANANAYVLVFNSTTGFGELWHDTNWSDQANRVQIATFENITTLAGVTAFDNGDFMVWA
ncbi:MAG: hypothetical protein KDJ63_11200, partial [Nitratireductor sp.]|nr:hypothetical protein [Nitratireductor sp.]